jgi:hypothetical protein
MVASWPCNRARNETLLPRSENATVPASANKILDSELNAESTARRSRNQTAEPFKREEREERGETVTALCELCELL